MGDMDVVECMVRWWASEDAARMRKEAEPLIESLNRRMFATKLAGAKQGAAA
jgi:hypothetical protein